MKIRFLNGTEVFSKKTTFLNENKIFEWNIWKPNYWVNTKAAGSKKKNWIKAQNIEWFNNYWIKNSHWINMPLLYKYSAFGHKTEILEWKNMIVEWNC